MTPDVGLSRAESIIEDVTNMRDKLRAFATEELKKYFLEFWEHNPAINIVFWAQYVPYHNDGDPCEFSVTQPSFTNAPTEDIDFLSPDFLTYEGNKENVWVLDYWDIKGKRKKKIPKDIDLDYVQGLNDLLRCSVIEETLESMFDYNVVVFATREGFTMRDYNLD